MFLLLRRCQLPALRPTSRPDLGSLLHKHSQTLKNTALPYCFSDKYFSLRQTRTPIHLCYSALIFAICPVTESRAHDQNLKFLLVSGNPFAATIALQALEETIATVPSERTEED